MSAEVDEDLMTCRNGYKSEGTSNALISKASQKPLIICIG